MHAISLLLCHLSFQLNPKLKPKDTHKSPTLDLPRAHILPEIGWEIAKNFSLSECRDKDLIKQLCALSLVCRSLRHAAQFFLFQHLEPTSQKELKLLLRTLTRSPELAHHVESLHAPRFIYTKY